MTSKLQQDLQEAESSNVASNAKLVVANELLDVANQNLKDNKRTISATSASFDEMKSQSDNLKDIVQSEISKLDDKIMRTESMLEGSNGDLQKCSRTMNKSLLRLLSYLIYPTKQHPSKVI